MRRAPRFLRARGGPLPKEGFHSFSIVFATSTQFQNVLRMDQSAVAFQHKKMRNSEELGVAGKGLSVLFIASVIDIHDHELCVAKLHKFRVFLEQLVHLVAIGAPVSAHIEQDPPAAPLCFDNCGCNVRARIALRIELVHWDIAGRVVN